MQAHVRQSLNEWDPIGIVNDADDDEYEYDSLISPLLHRLHARQSTEQLVAWLVSDVSKDFGLTFTGEGERRLVDSLQTWWAETTGITPTGA